MKRRAIGEIGAVVLTGATFLVFENVLHLKLQFLIPCVLGWTAYIVWRLRQDRSVLASWGLRTDNLGPAAAESAAFFFAAAMGLAGFRLFGGWEGLPGNAAWLFALYPFWAFLQQFMVQALVTRNLRELGVPKAVIIPVAAVLFGLAHAPDWALSGLCVGAGAMWTFLFLRKPNLIPIALAHAWLGALTYYWVLRRDPWGEMFAPR